MTGNGGKTMKARMVSVISVLVLGLAVSEAWGFDSFTPTSNVTAQTFSNAASHFLNLTGQPGNASLVVTSPNLGEDELLIIWFAAECSVAAPDRATWLDLDILVNGVALPPTNNDNAFCTSTGSNALDSWVSTAIHGAIVGATTVPAVVGGPPYTIQVRGTLRNFNAGESWRIDDLSLIVHLR
jgi:hypothetical protein